MAKASPGGVLAIAVGVAFLSLGWTGRYAAVWEAFRTGASAGTGGAPQNPVTPNNTGAAAIQDPVYVLIQPSGTRKVTDAPNVRGSENNTCGAQFQKVKLENNSDGKIYCVDPGKLFDPLPITPQGNAAGQVVDPSDYSSVLLPTGAFAMRYQPNVKESINVS